MKLGELLKDEKGIPCPVAGTYWPLSHKPKCVAAVVSKDKVGIDISGLKACRIISVPDERHIILDHRDRLFQVEQVHCKNHIISVLKDDNEIDWIILEDFKLEF